MQRAQYGRKAARTMQVFHVVAARRFQVDKDRRLTRQTIEGSEIHVDAQATSHGCDVNDAVGRSADGGQDAQGIGKRIRRHDLLGRQSFRGQAHGPRTGRFRMPQTVSVSCRDRSATGQHHPQRFRHQCHRARGAHDPAGAGARYELGADLLDLLFVDLTSTVLSPVTPAIGAGTQALATVAARHHRSCHHENRRYIRTCRPHQQGRHGLIATADQHDCIHRLRADHLFGIHRHQVTQEHAAGMGKRLVQRYRRELYR